MKVALSSFNDLPPCESTSWVTASNLDDMDFDLDTTFSDFESKATASTTNTRQYSIAASLDALVVEHPSLPPMPTAHHTWQHPATEDPTQDTSLSPQRKRKHSSTVERSEDSSDVLEGANYITDAPTERDVFLGRGGKANTHVGNTKWLEEKNKLQYEYWTASKGNKQLISQQLVDCIRRKGGRFLRPVKLQEKPPVYRYIEVVDNKTLLKKASQTLRETNSAEVYEAKRKMYPPAAAAPRR